MVANSYIFFSSKRAYHYNKIGNNCIVCSINCLFDQGISKAEANSFNYVFFKWLRWLQSLSHTSAKYMDIEKWIDIPRQGPKIRNVTKMSNNLNWYDSSTLLDQNNLLFCSNNENLYRLSHSFYRQKIIVLCTITRLQFAGI